MSKLVSLNVDVTKLNKDRFYKGEKGTYAKLDVWIDQEASEDWKVVSVSESLTKEERDAKHKKNYVGNGKLLYGWDESKPASKPAAKSDDPVGEDVPF